MNHNDSLDSVNLLYSVEITPVVEVALSLQCTLLLGGNSTVQIQNVRQGYFQDSHWIKN